MEPVEAPVVFVASTSVLDVRVIDGLWFVHFEGSRESIALAPESDPAPFTVGDHVEITFQKAQAPDAPPIPTSI